jgi:2'-5' RNA ligase
MSTERAGNWFVGWPVLVPGGWLAPVRSGAPAGIRWFAESDLHVTLAFLGRFHAERFDAVAALLGTVMNSPAMISLGALRLLPNPRRFSAISFEVTSGHEELCGAIARHRADFCAAAGVAADARAPLAHVTIARPERVSAAAARREITEWAGGVTLADRAVGLGPLSIFAWANNRPARQFEIIANASNTIPR